MGSRCCGEEGHEGGWEWAVITRVRTPNRVYRGGQSSYLFLWQIGVLCSRYLGSPLGISPLPRNQIVCLSLPQYLDLVCTRVYRGMIYRGKNVSSNEHPSGGVMVRPGVVIKVNTIVKENTLEIFFETGLYKNHR